MQNRSYNFSAASSLQSRTLKIFHTSLLVTETRTFSLDAVALKIMYRYYISNPRFRSRARMLQTVHRVGQSCVCRSYTHYCLTLLLLRDCHGRRAQAFNAKQKASECVQIAQQLT
jgi:hypothetical protein